MAGKPSTLAEADRIEEAKCQAGAAQGRGQGKARRPQATGRQPHPPGKRTDRPHPEVPARTRRPSRHKPSAPRLEEQPLSEPTSAPVVLSQAQAMQELVRRAGEGNEACLKGLRELLDATPAIWQAAGNVSALAERHWVEALSGGNKLADESIPRRLKQFKAQLLGSGPTPLETLLVDVIGVSWLAAQHGEIDASRQDGSTQQIASRLRRAESGQKRLLGAVKTLAVVRALLPRTRAPARAQAPAGLPGPGD